MSTRSLAVRLLFAGALTMLAKGSALAQEIGADCIDCHEATVSPFARSIHSKTAFYGKPGSCESCHRGAAAHAQSGEPSMVFNPGKASAEEGSATCLSCHGNGRSQMFWKGSAHPRQSVGCTSCHSVHGGRTKLLVKADENALCFTCHPAIRAEVLKRSKHPLRDSSLPSMGGKLTCSACHDPHGARSRALIAARSINDKCFECHFEKRAPVLWEHQPVKQDCLICHTAHGSAVDKLLTTRVPRLCQECHMQGRHQSGTFSTSSIFAVNRSCLNCHAQVHGSNNPSGAVLQR